MKITTIGAGSIAWGPAINIDFLSNPKLDGAELMLMDIDADALARVARLLERLVAERGITKTITATTDLTSALRDATLITCWPRSRSAVIVCGGTTRCFLRSMASISRWGTRLGRVGWCGHCVTPDRC
ncbi:MAG: hypothetical protein ACRDJH_06105 [Thermomicrobiales bacterium]